LFAEKNPKFANAVPSATATPPLNLAEPLMAASPPLKYASLTYLQEKGGELEIDGTLVDRLQLGDENALDSLYRKYSSLLYSVALRILGDTAAAEEVLQDTFFQLWQNAGKFDSGRGSLTGWLLVITRSRSLTRLRSTGHARFCDADEALLLADLGPTALDQQIARQLVSNALLGLPKPQQEAITLAYFEGLTSSEIALRTNVPLGTVKSRLRTALGSMKKNLHESTKSNGETTLNDILITDQILSRPLRMRKPRQDSESLRILELAALISPERLVDAFLELALDLCDAGTAGLSFLETGPDGKQVFRWTNLAGKLQAAVGGSTPRNFSPCGVTLDRNSPQLFSKPGRYFHYFNEVDLPIVEGLVIPFHVGRDTKGTVWIVSHEEYTPFDSEDARIMTALTEYAASGFHLSRSLRSLQMGMEQKTGNV
jgi:RNA polymerase sigma factor (sigma-70 family)